MVVSRDSLRVGVERQDVTDDFIEIFGLVEQGLAMKCGDVLVKIHSKEIETADPRLLGSRITSKVLLKIVGSFRGDGSNLLIASSISGNEENGNSM